MERGCFNCKHKNNGWIFRCAKCAYEKYYLWTPMTNADKIRQSLVTNADNVRKMSNEELAEWIVRSVLNITSEGQFDVAKKAWLKWLKEEVITSEEERGVSYTK